VDFLILSHHFFHPNCQLAITKDSYNGVTVSASSCAPNLGYIITAAQGVQVQLSPTVAASLCRNFGLVPLLEPVLHTHNDTVEIAVQAIRALSATIRCGLATPIGATRTAAENFCQDRNADPYLNLIRALCVGVQSLPTEVKPILGLLAKTPANADAEWSGYCINTQLDSADVAVAINPKSLAPWPQIILILSQTPSGECTCSWAVTLSVTESSSSHSFQRLRDSICWLMLEAIVPAPANTPEPQDQVHNDPVSNSLDHDMTQPQANKSKTKTCHKDKAELSKSSSTKARTLRAQPSCESNKSKASVASLTSDDGNVHPITRSARNNGGLSETANASTSTPG
jgi:hypothetical protein